MRRCAPIGARPRRAPGGLIGDEPTPAAALDDAVRAGLTASGIPGAVVLVARQGTVVHLGASGAASTHDQSGPLRAPVRMVPDTVFDVASITKLVATTGAAMAMVDQGKLDPEASASWFLPELHGRGKDEITVAHLLAHRSGLPAWHPLFLHSDDRAEAVRVACAQPLVASPGAERIYSDLGMIVLGAILERVCDERLDVAASRLVFEPLGMDRTRFLPRTRKGVAATSTGNPTERDLVAAMPDGAAPADRAHAWRSHTLVGEANDANAAVAMGGVAGHAGVFSTARDLARFAQALLDSGSGEGQRVWSPSTVGRFLRPGPDPAQGLGVWLGRASAALGVELGDDASFGHRGFTGCELAASPQGRWVAVLLTNRLHADAHPPPAHDDVWREVVSWVLAGVQADRAVGEPFAPPARIPLCAPWIRTTGPAGRSAGTARGADARQVRVVSDSTPPVEDALLARAARGDEDAVSALYEAYAGPVYGYGLRRLNDSLLAEELVQMVMTSLWRHGGRYQPARGSVRTWVFSIARNAAVDLHRRQPRANPVADVPEEAETTGELDRLLRAEAVRTALDQLSDDHREVLELGYFRGLSQPEIAARLGLPLGTVKSRTFYALKAFRLACDEIGVDE